MKASPRGQGLKPSKSSPRAKVTVTSLTTPASTPAKPAGGQGLGSGLAQGQGLGSGLGQGQGLGQNPYAITAQQTTQYGYGSDSLKLNLNGSGMKTLSGESFITPRRLGKLKQQMLLLPASVADGKGQDFSLYGEVFKVGRTLDDTLNHSTTSNQSINQSINQLIIAHTLCICHPLNTPTLLFHTYFTLCDSLFNNTPRKLTHSSPSLINLTLCHIRWIVIDASCMPCSSTRRPSRRFP